MSEMNEAVPQPNFIDRKTRLTVFGVLQIVLGGFCAMAVPMMIVGMIASQLSEAQPPPESANIRTVIPGMLFYVIIAVWFVSMGIGSLKARRWARALILVSSWLWLICGTIGFIMMLMIFPSMAEQMSANTNGQMPKAAAIIFQCIMVGFMMVFYIIIPSLLVLFYRGRDVKATCEYYDPQIRWTDKCPLPVLAACLIFIAWAVSMPLMGATNWVIPFFGTLLSGGAGAIAAIVLCLILAFVARGLYRLDHMAWWAALLLICSWSASTIITFSTMNTDTYYEKAGMTAQQIETIKQFDMLSNPKMRVGMVIWAAITLVYLLWIRKFFVNTPDQQTSPFD